MTDLAARRGGMLGATFAVRGHPGLKRLVISNSPASMPLWVESCNEWRKQLPEDVEKALQKHEADKTYDDPECDSSRKKPLPLLLLTSLILTLTQINGRSKNSVRGLCCCRL
jgi:hypothetical protein